MGRSSTKRLSPTERANALFLDLCNHYDGDDDKELRAASKMLMVALARLREHGGAHWDMTLDAYVKVAKNRPEKLDKVLQKCNRGRKSG